MSDYYPSYPLGGQTVVVTPPRCSTAHIVIAWVLTVLTGGYLLPWAIAATRGHKDVGGIALVDLLLGWSLIGWIVSLVWAVSDTGGRHPVVVVQHGYAYPPRAHPQIAAQPYGQPSALPYGQPSALSYGQPSALSYGQPSAQPYGQPSAQPYGQPSALPYSQPSATQPYPILPASADPWPPAPWDRSTGPGTHG